MVDEIATVDSTEVLISVRIQCIAASKEINYGATN